MVMGYGGRGCPGWLQNLRGWSVFMAMGGEDVQGACRTLGAGQYLWLWEGGRGCSGCLQNLRG